MVRVMVRDMVRDMVRASSFSWPGTYQEGRQAREEDQAGGAWRPCKLADACYRMYAVMALLTMALLTMALISTYDGSN